jgi:hypothetical protein
LQRHMYRSYDNIKTGLKETRCEDVDRIHLAQDKTSAGIFFNYFVTNKTNSVTLVHQRTTPAERPPLVGEVSANFSG